MQIDKDLVKKLEQLSKIELNDTEREIVKNDLEKIITYMNKVSEVDGQAEIDYLTNNIENFRNDTVECSTNRDDILKNAPAKKDGYYVVPKTVE